MDKFDYYIELDPVVYVEIFKYNVYQIFEHDIKNANILDVGGQYGMFTNFCGQYGPKQIIAVEANPYNYLKFIKYTRDLPFVKAINAAVSTKENELVTIDNNGGLSTVGNGNINVATITLDTLIDCFPSGEDIILKMDIEGAEYDVLFNLSHEKLRRFNIIGIEVHQTPTSKYKFGHMINYLLTHGYNCVWQAVYVGVKDKELVDNYNYNDYATTYKFIRV